MEGKIGFEEHFAIAETNNVYWWYKDVEDWFTVRIMDLIDLRLKEMDEHGMEMMILSLNSPAIQGIYDRKEAVEIAKKANDEMAEAIAKVPNRFRGFAAVPLQDVDAAILEMHRAVKDLGCVGVLVNGFVQIDSEENYKYLDEPIFRPFWAELEKLDIPFYMHPRDPMPCNLGSIEGHPWLRGAVWMFGVETATHTMRLMCSGLFDEYPMLKFILGHLGEMLPFCIYRSAFRISKTNRGLPAKRPLNEYMMDNMYYTTSGHFHTASMRHVIAEFGIDRVLFSTDYPFEEVSDACVWFDNCDINENDRMRIGRTNAISLFKLDI